MSRGPGGTAALAAAVVRRPDLWRTAARFVPPKWWRRRPPLPLPAADYLRFRMETMYGADSTGPGGAGRTRLSPEELIRYLEWCRRVGPAAR